MQLTTALKKISLLKERVKPVQGGTSAGKTYSILQIWIINCLEGNPKFKGINSIVSESLPHLKRGAMRDFFHILELNDIYDIKNHNKTDKTYIINGCTIEFFGIDDPSKLKGGRRLNLFINEADNNPIEAYNQLEVRTKYNIWLDWNPVADFWAMHLGVEPIIITYLDNEMLDANIIKSIESRRNNEQWFRVYGLGLVGTLEGQIYKNWDIIDAVPKDAELLCSGLDFGFSQDPTAVVTLYRYDSEIIIKQILFKKGMLNSEIAAFLKGKELGVVYADSAEPKSIKEISTYGIRILGAKKGKDSVKYGIDLLQDFKLRPTRDSLELIKALRNYSWNKDKYGKHLNKPNHAFSDILDATRYAAVMRLKNNINNYNYSFV